MKPSDPFSATQADSEKYYALRIRRVFYLIGIVAAGIWFCYDVRWEPLALAFLFLFGLGSLGPAFAQVSPKMLWRDEVLIPIESSDSIVLTWFKMWGDGIAQVSGLVLQGLMSMFFEGLVYLVVGGCAALLAIIFG
jgi:hypothetical protein